MRRHSYVRAFTLIELLVVVAIIALLIAILLPSLAAARDKAKNVTCLANLKSNGTALFNYATQFSGRLPYDGVSEGDLFWDWEGYITDDLWGTNGVIRKTYYCPVNTNQNVDNLWTTSGSPTSNGTFATDSVIHRALGYFYILNRAGNKSCVWLLANPGNPPKYPKVTLIPHGNADDQELMTDITLQSESVATNYSAITFSGGGGVTLGTSHMKGSKPDHTNIDFIDGHAEGRPFSQMQNRAQGSKIGAHDQFIELF